MYRIIPAVTVALGLAASASAQDSTVRSKTKVSVDEGRTITLTGCLEKGAANLFTLRGSGAVSSDDVTTKSKVRTDVDDDETKTKSRTEIEHDGDVNVAAAYVLTPQRGIDLASHVGKRVQITAVELDPDEDDAEVEIKERTKIEREDAPDVRQKSDKKTEISRGDHGSVTVVAVKPIGGTCNR